MPLLGWLQRDHVASNHGCLRYSAYALAVRALRLESIIRHGLRHRSGRARGESALNLYRSFNLAMLISCVRKARTRCKDFYAPRSLNTTGAQSLNVKLVLSLNELETCECRLVAFEIRSSLSIPTTIAARAGHLSGRLARISERPSGTLCILSGTIRTLSWTSRVAACARIYPGTTRHSSMKKSY